MAAMNRAKIPDPAKRNFFMVLLFPDLETMGEAVVAVEIGGAATAAPHFVQKLEVSSARDVPQAVQKRAMRVLLY
jgi:hypothetical protein